MKKLLGLFLSVVLLLANLTGCSIIGNNSEVILKFATASLDGKFNPVFADGVYDAYVATMVFDGLVGNDPEGKITLDGLASKYVVSNSNKTYTFTLRNGLKFHDGTDVTAADVKFSYEILKNSKYDGPFAYLADDFVGADDYNKGKATDITGIKVINDKTISFTVTLARANKIYDFSLGILSKDYYKFTTMEELKAKNATPMGTGRFIFKDYTPAQACNLTANKSYFGKKAKISGVSIVIVPDETQIQALGNSSVDLVNPSASKDNYDSVIATQKADVIKFTGNGYNFIGINHKDPILADKNVRQALVYGVNIKQFIDNQYQGFAEQCLAPISPVSWAYPGKSELNSYAFNPEKAKTLLEASGWKVGSDGYRVKDGKKLSLKILIYNEAPWPASLVALATEQWKSIGVELKSETNDFDTVMDKVYEKRDMQLWTQGWSMSIDPDPTGLLDKASFTQAGGYNAGGYINDESEILIQKGRYEFNQAKRATIYKDWAKLVNDDLPYIFCANRQEIWGVSKKVKGLDEMSPYYNWVQCLGDVTISK